MAVYGGLKMKDVNQALESLKRLSKLSKEKTLNDIKQNGGYKKNDESKTIVKYTGSSKVNHNKIRATWGNKILDEGFTAVPNILLSHFLEIGLNTNHLIFILLIFRYSFKGSKSYPSQSLICEKTGFSQRKLARIILDLKVKGYMTVYKRYFKRPDEMPHRSSNIYDLKGLLNKLNSLVFKE